MLRKLVAETFGTMVLVLFGCGAAVLAGDQVGQLGIALAFGFAIVAMAYGIGPVSGCHVNPAVSLAAFVAKRMSAKDMVFYWVAQLIGALIGAFILSLLAKSGMEKLGQNGWGPGYLGEYSLQAAAIFEVVATAIFTVVILGVTGSRGANSHAGLATSTPSVVTSWISRTMRTMVARLMPKASSPIRASPDSFRRMRL